MKRGCFKAITILVKNIMTTTIMTMLMMLMTMRATMITTMLMTTMPSPSWSSALYSGSSLTERFTSVPLLTSV